jgi:cell division protein FtsZ
VIPNDKLMEVLGEDVTLLDAFKAANDVLHGAVAGIAEIINCPGMINVDFADVRTVMSEMGMAMMGSASASGDRPRAHRRRAGRRLPAARGRQPGGRARRAGQHHRRRQPEDAEMHEVMNTIKGFTAEDATVIVGTVFDEAMGDSLRVTMVATGLGTSNYGTCPRVMTVNRRSRDATARR